MTDEFTRHIVWGGRSGSGARARAEVNSIIRGMKPGQMAKIHRQTFELAFPPMDYRDAHWTSADRFLENSVGSAYGVWRVTQDPLSGNYTISRHEEGNEQVWTSPDRR